MKSDISELMEKLDKARRYLPADIFKDLKVTVEAVVRVECLLTGDEVAKRLGVSRTTVWRYTREEGLLPFVELPRGQFRVKESDLDNFIKKRSVTPIQLIEQARKLCDLIID